MSKIYNFPLFRRPARGNPLDHRLEYGATASTCASSMPQRTCPSQVRRKFPGVHHLVIMILPKSRGGRTTTENYLSPGRRTDVVPLDLKRYPVLKTIHRMSGRQHFLPVNTYLRSQSFFCASPSSITLYQSSRRLLISTNKLISQMPGT